MQSRIGVLAVSLLGVVLAILLPATLLAQYVYIDANANGVHDAGDAMSPNGTPTVVDVWIDTNHNRDGSLAACDTHDGDLGTWNSFAMHMAVAGGTVSFTDYENRFPAFAISCSAAGQAFQSSSTAMAACQFGVPQPGGHVKMFTMTVTGLTGSPSLLFVPSNSLDSNPTSFGTPCSGVDFDNTYKLGRDWFDADGLAAACVADCAPFLQPVADMTVDEGATATQPLNASDPDGGPIQFQKVTGPPFMMVTTTDANAGIGAIVLSPGYTDAGSGIQASVRASDGTHLSDARSFRITVNAVNRAPIADAGGPYSGIAGVPIAFDGSASSDPDGDALGFAWTFGDLAAAVGPTPAHTYAAGGTYTVVLTVRDGSLSASATTLATITDLFAARAFTTRANRLLRLGSGKQTWSIEIEPIASSFNVADVDYASVRMKSTGTGTVSEIHVAAGKTPSAGDVDGNGTPDFPATFARQDLEALFASVSGSTTVPVTIEGEISSGGTFRAQADVGVVAAKGPAAVSVFPNPLNPTGEVWFRVTAPGRVRVELFDVSGRMVRVLADRFAGVGSQRCAIDGKNHEGATLASGVYYLRISTVDGTMTRRLAIVK